MLFAQGSQPIQSQSQPSSRRASLAELSQNSAVSLSVYAPEEYSNESFDTVLVELGKTTSDAETEFAKFCISVFKHCRNKADPWQISWMYKQDTEGRQNKLIKGNTYQNKYQEILGPAAELMIKQVEATYASGDKDLKTHERATRRRRVEAATALIRKAKKSVQKAMQRHFKQQEKDYLESRNKGEAGTRWRELRERFAKARTQERELVASKLGGPTRKPTGKWMAEQFDLHSSITRIPEYARAQGFLWGAKQKETQDLLHLSQAEELLGQHDIPVTAGYSELAYSHFERECKQGNYTAARAWLIDAIYRGRLWSVAEEQEWVDYFQKVGRKNLSATNTHAQISSLLSGVEGNLVHLLSGVATFEYHEVKASNYDAKIDTNAAWTEIHPSEAHSIFGHVCTDPRRKYQVKYTASGGLSLWAEPGVHEGEPYTFYGSLSAVRAIADPTDMNTKRRSQRGDFSHRHALHGTKVLLCGRFTTPNTPAGAGQWANHPAPGRRASLKTKRYAVRYQDSDEQARVFYVLVLCAAADHVGRADPAKPFELTHDYEDRFPPVRRACVLCCGMWLSCAVLLLVERTCVHM
jgi:hypothetical protein